MNIFIYFYLNKYIYFTQIHLFILHKYIYLFYISKYIYLCLQKCMQKVLCGGRNYAVNIFSIDPIYHFGVDGHFKSTELFEYVGPRIYHKQSVCVVW